MQTLGPWQTVYKMPLPEEVNRLTRSKAETYAGRVSAAPGESF